MDKKHGPVSGGGDAPTFELTLFGRRRKRALRPATLLKLALVGGISGMAWFLL